ncbi:Phototropin-2 [Dactylellina cionopaga]|nr:Phototropin-2 [Dactylellina cionopaga]
MTGDTQAASTVKPGLLVFTLYEAKGLTLPNIPTAPKGLVSGVAGSQTSARPVSSQARIAGSLASGSRPGTSSSRPGTGHNHGGGISPLHFPYCVLEFDKTEVFLTASPRSTNATTPIYDSPGNQYKFDVSRETDLTLQLYLRNPLSKGSNRENDFFLGSCKVTPRFEETTSQQAASSKSKSSVQTTPQPGHAGIDWVNLGFGTGSVRIGLDYVANPSKPLTIENFDLLKVVGKGSFGKVMQVRKKDTSRIYALKTIRKAHIINRAEVTHTLAERTVLAQINNPFIVPLKFSFQSPEKLYLVLAFVNGGELFHHLQREGRFDINRSRFYTAELLCALECLHGFNVIYRDLKPENILLDYTGHIALCDFGLCKLNMKEDDKTNTFCGTPEYIAPELLLSQGYTKTVDWWTLGVLLYEMLTGLPPFYDENTNEMYRKILQDPLLFPGPEIVPQDARDLLGKLLNRDPTKRLGANGAAEIKNHKFFESIDWKRLVQKKLQPTFKPAVENALDTDNFAQEFTEEPPADSVIEGDGRLSQSHQNLFEGWSYRGRGMAGPAEGNMSIKDTFLGNGSVQG